MTRWSGHRCPVPRCTSRITGDETMCPACMGNVSVELKDVLRLYQRQRVKYPNDEALRERHARVYAQAIEEATHPVPLYRRAPR